MYDDIKEKFSKIYITINCIYVGNIKDHINDLFSHIDICYALGSEFYYSGYPNKWSYDIRLNDYKYPNPRIDILKSTKKTFVGYNERNSNLLETSNKDFNISLLRYIRKLVSNITDQSKRFIRLEYSFKGLIEVED